MQRVCRRCASSAARASESHDSVTGRKPSIREVLTQNRAARQALQGNAEQKKVSIRDFVRAKAAEIQHDAKQLSRQDLADKNYSARVRGALAGLSVREQLKIARESKEEANYAFRPSDSPIETKASRDRRKEELSHIGEDESLDLSVPLQIFPGDLVEYWPDNGARQTAIVLQLPDESSGKRYSIIDERGLINYVNSVRFRFVLHDFYDKSKLPKAGAVMFQRDEIFIPMRQVLKQFKNTVSRVRGGKFEALNNIYRQLPTHLKESTTPISSREICQRVFGEATKAQLYATCEALILDRKHFLMDIIPNMTVPMFSVRKPEVVEMIEHVTTWTNTRAPQFRAFIKRARAVAEYGRSVTRTLDGPLKGIDAPLTFNHDDQNFLQFMRAACLERPERMDCEIYTTPLAVIVKELDLTPTQKANRRAAFDCLKLLGVIAPWENNLASLEAAAASSSTSSPAAREFAEYEAANFAPNQVESLDRLGLHDRSESLRHDFGQLPVYAIDGAHAAELDDGLSFDGEWLHIHIADPASFIPYGSKLAQMAEFRGVTLYSVNGVSPMLPWSLAMQHFSLGAKSPQPVMTTSVRLGSKGQILDMQVRPAIVRNIKQFTYEAVDELVFGLDNAEKNGIVSVVNWTENTIATTSTGRSTMKPQNEDKQTIIKMNNALQSFRKYRLEHGALDFFDQEKEFAIQPKDLPLSRFNVAQPHFYSGRPGIRQTVTSASVSAARSLVQESALLANSAVANFAAEHKIPIMYKVFHSLFDDDDRAKLRALQDSHGRLKYNELGAFAPRILAAQASLKTGPADLLGLPGGYTYSTSPLRRFWDLTTQWQLQSYLLGEPYQADLRRILLSFSRRENAVKKINSAAGKGWTLQLLHQQMERGETPVFVATIISNNSNINFPSSGIIDSIFQRCQVRRAPTDPVVDAGTSVKVVIDEIDLMDNVLYVRRIDL